MYGFLDIVLTFFHSKTGKAERGITLSNVYEFRSKVIQVIQTLTLNSMQTIRILAQGVL